MSLTNNRFRPALLSAAIAAATSVSMGSFAQEQDEALEEVVVTGIRSSIVDSVSAKRNSDVVAEVVDAGDLASLPDSSIADALTRLPGVTAVRTGGQASGLNIRGMDGGFVFASLNGREQVTTGGSRAIEFDQYPSELISQATVYKSPKASLIEGGVAGTVELKTANPLDNAQDHTFHVSTRGMVNDRGNEIDDADKIGHRFTASYQGKFADDTLGVALGYARLYQPSASSQFVGFQYNGSGVVDGESVAVSEGFEAQVRGGEETRDGFMGAIQWEPNENLSVQGDVFHSKFDSENYARGFRVKTLQNGTLSNETVNNGAVTGATVSGDGSGSFAVFNINDNDSRYTEVLSGGINVTWNQGPLTLSSDISYSEADGEFVNGGTRAILYNDASNPTSGRAPETIHYLLNGLNPASFTADQSYTDLNTIALTEVGMWPYINRNELNAYKFDMKYELDMGFVSSVEAGVRYSEREFSAQRQQAGYGWEFGGHPTELPIQLTADMVDVVSFGGELSGYPDFLAIDFDDAVALVNAANAEAGRDPFEATSNWDNNWTMIQSGKVNEDVLAAYFQANIESELFGISVTGNMGVRVVDTEQYSTGLLQIGGGLGTPITDERGVTSSDYIASRVGQEYTDYLPSANLNFHLTDRDQLRFALAKVMSRPPIDKLKAGGGSWVEEGATEDRFNVWGNTSPLLNPMYANQLDVSYEHYFEETEGAIVAAFFYKDIESLVTDITIDPFDFEAAGIDIPDVNPASGHPFVGGQFQTAYNNEDAGYIRGIELAYTQTFEFLPGIWSGLGLTTSYSYTESEIDAETGLSGESITIPMPGLSKNVFNTTVFYDYDSFSTRVSARYRDSYVGQQLAVDSQLAFFDSETVVDYQASYQLENGVEIVFQVNNLTDEPNKTYFGNEAQTGTIQYFGRQYFLGANYTF
ncbi:TonB-dependent receptor [Microbulbifer sp. SH-1]|uniref:TonB-dependent receptor n=1 Tax=Microbulbifer sp. SH-1 TaxID=2681547 RepID=UPI00140C2352|nr:TonB-dependent receptor [Microbulbifer sp. SH-1]QIL90226.1 TonB-dependent receptor [Microbulbifer sp. SH-1]